MQHPQRVRLYLGQWWWLACLSGVVVVLLSGGHATHAETPSSPPFPLPDVLRPNVAFWTHIFTALDSTSGVLHDAHDLSIVYHTVHALPQSPAARRTVIHTSRARYQRILETLAQGKRHHLHPDEARVLALFAGQQHPARLRAAAASIRFQQGIRDRFAAGLVRSTAYLSDMERIFVAAGLPRELVLLPHVESSFQRHASSKAGAAGLWQFTRGTGRRFLRINGKVDERFDVRLSTQAAARLLRENYAMLGTWPLAITAYNHGAAGMQRAVQTVGTTDFGAIVTRYRGPLFGFASRNFYAEFLAAVHVVQHHRQYFPHLVLARSPYVQRAALPAAEAMPSSQHATATPSHGQTYRVRPGDTLWAIARRFGTTTSQLATLNGLQHRRLITPGQTLRLPAGVPQEHTTPTERRGPRIYRVRPGDTLSAIARRYGTTVRSLVVVNGLQSRQLIQVGQRLILPALSRRAR